MSVYLGTSARISVACGSNAAWNSSTELKIISAMTTYVIAVPGAPPESPCSTVVSFQCRLQQLLHHGNVRLHVIRHVEPGARIVRIKHVYLDHIFSLGECHNSGNADALDFTPRQDLAADRAAMALALLPTPSTALPALERTKSGVEA